MGQARGTGWGTVCAVLQLATVAIRVLELCQSTPSSTIQASRSDDDEISTAEIHTAGDSTFARLRASRLLHAIIKYFRKRMAVCRWPHAPPPPASTSRRAGRMLSFGVVGGGVTGEGPSELRGTGGLVASVAATDMRTQRREDGRRPWWWRWPRSGVRLAIHQGRVTATAYSCCRPIPT